MTRGDDVRAADRVPYRLLDAQPELDGGDSDAANMLIQGDNLDALKALLPFYAGRVKCIYIDPPYNTRSAFQHYDDNLQHSKWLAMIYPRLVLLRDADRRRQHLGQHRRSRGPLSQGHHGRGFRTPELRCT